VRYTVVIDFCQALLGWRTGVERFVLKIHAENESKYVYFLLGATGAALGYALQKLDGVAFSWWSAPAVAALVFWLSSFYCGCRRIVWVQAAIRANYSLLQLKSGQHPEQPPDNPQLLQAALNGTSAAIKHNTNRATLFFNLQFALLATGVLFFTVWRLLAMLKITLTA
jgi:hypothetical protein